MTREEAKKIAAICSTADNGCAFCVYALMEQLVEAFPEFEWKTNGDCEIEVEPKGERAP